MKKNFNTLVFTLAVCYCLSILPVIFTGCANSTGDNDKGKTNSGATPKPSSPLVSFESTPFTRTGVKKTVNGHELEIVKFGDWPQTEKAEDVTIDYQHWAVVGNNLYYPGDDGEFYFKIENSRNPTTRQIEHAYFKVEPIEWYILTSDYNGTGKTLLYSTKILNYESFSDYNEERTIDDNEIQPSDYEYSLVRAWLNGLSYERNPDRDSSGIYIKHDNSELEGKGFLQSAFDSAGQNLIEETEVSNKWADSEKVGTTYRSPMWDLREFTTKDKIFLLSRKEASTTEYGFLSHALDPDTNKTIDGDELAELPLTDYAKRRGYPDDAQEFGNWLRSPCQNKTAYYAGTMWDNKTLTEGSIDPYTHCSYYYGIAPALCIKGETNNDIPESETPYKKLPEGTNGSFGPEKTYVTFGEWPQSEKAANVTIAEDAETRSQGGYTYKKGSDGKWYFNNKDKYYLVEPITWCIVTNNYNGTGKKLLVTEKILINSSFYGQSKYEQRPLTIDGESITIYPQNYEYSQVRAWINGLPYTRKTSYMAAPEEYSAYKDKGFLHKAFTEEEQSKICVTEVDNSADSTTDSSETVEKVIDRLLCNNTNDKIFLLSLKEVTSSNLGFAAYDEGGEGSPRIRKAVDFAVDNGTYVDENESFGSPWFLRSPANDTTVNANGAKARADIVSTDGKADSSELVNDAKTGIIMALCVD